MRFYFSKRHEVALKEKKLQPSFTKKLRTSICRVLENYSEWQPGDYEDEYENITFKRVEEVLKTFYGEEHLRAYNDDGERVPATLEKVIESEYPTRVLDVIEAWLDEAGSSKATECERELNSIFEIHNSHWRVVNASVFLVDSEYLHNEIVSKTKKLLQENRIEGALEEFTDALMCLMEDRTKEAVINAHKSVESVMKTILNARHLTFGKLLDKLSKSGIIPNYYEGFMTHFEKLLSAVAIERNRPGRGHGQGVDMETVPKSLSEFCVHLAAVINLFLIKRWLELPSDKTE